MLENCDFNHNLYIDGFQNGDYYFHEIIHVDKY